MARLAAARVILFGVGGVGSWCAEALVRTGIGHLTIVDSDGVCVTNVNRQLQATTATVGRVKVEELATRLRQINPAATIEALHRAYGLETRETFSLETFDYVVDAIDSLSPKLNLIMHALELGRTVFSCMGASGKLDPTRVRIDSIWSSSGCPLASRIRSRLRRRGVTQDFKVVFSPELREHRGQAGHCGTDQCHCPKFLHLDDGQKIEAHEWCSSKAFINGSLVQVTATFGMFLASLVINDVLEKAGPLPPERGTFDETADSEKPPLATVFSEFTFGSPQYLLAWQLREDVLRTPIGRTLKDEDLSAEADQLHFGLFDGDGAILACMIVAPLGTGEARIRQMAVRSDLRGRGLGRQLMQAGEQVLETRGFRKLVLHSRRTAVGFYRRLGYEVVGHQFEEVGLPHLLMEKRL